jgi:hypothetical protein
MQVTPVPTPAAAASASAAAAAAAGGAAAAAPAAVAAAAAAGGDAGTLWSAILITIIAAAGAPRAGRGCDVLVIMSQHGGLQKDAPPSTHNRALAAT